MKFDYNCGTLVSEIEDVFRTLWSFCSNYERAEIYIYDVANVRDNYTQIPFYDKKSVKIFVMNTAVLQCMLPLFIKMGEAKQNMAPFQSLKTYVAGNHKINPSFPIHSPFYFIEKDPLHPTKNAHMYVFIVFETSSNYGKIACENKTAVFGKSAPLKFACDDNFIMKLALELSSHEYKFPSVSVISNDNFNKPEEGNPELTLDERSRIRFVHVNMIDSPADDCSIDFFGDDIITCKSTSCHYTYPSKYHACPRCKKHMNGGGGGGGGGGSKKPKRRRKLKSMKKKKMKTLSSSRHTKRKPK